MQNIVGVVIEQGMNSRSVKNNVSKFIGKNMWSKIFMTYYVGQYVYNNYLKYKYVRQYVYDKICGTKFDVVDMKNWM